MKNKLEARQIEYNDCLNVKHDKKIVEQIWWMNAIFGKKKLLHTILLSKRHFSKPKLIKAMRINFEAKFTEEGLLEEILQCKYLDQPLASYILQPPSLADFFEAHQDFAYLQEHIDHNNVEKSVSKLLSKIYPKPEFQKGKINFMSIHKSKGLQSEYVFITGLVTGILPNKNKGVDSIEAQRRLLFVGMTRALKELDLISPILWDTKQVHTVDKSQFKFDHRSRKMRGKASSFLEKLSRKEV